MQRGNSLSRARPVARKPVIILLSLLSVALLVLAGCGPRATGGTLVAQADESQIVVDLPALVIDVQSDGSTSIGGTSLSDVAGLVGQDLSGLSVPADTVDFLVSSNIQHIQIDNTPEGLLILVNGEPVPSLAWDGEKLVATAEVLESLGAGVTLLDRVLPLVRNLGIGTIVRFPVPEGEEAIPLVVTDSETASAALAAQEEFLAAVGSPPTFQFVIEYAEDGSWTVGDMTQAEWSQLAAAVPWEMLNLSPGVVQGASNAGINEIGLATNTDGIFISVNGQTLPYITWADGRVQHLLDLAEQTGMLSGVMGATPDTEMLLQTVESLLPAVQASNVSLRVVFP